MDLKDGHTPSHVKGVWFAPCVREVQFQNGQELRRSSMDVISEEHKNTGLAYSSILNVKRRSSKVTLSPLMKTVREDNEQSPGEQTRGDNQVKLSNRFEEKSELVKRKKNVKNTCPSNKSVERHVKRELKLNLYINLLNKDEENVPEGCVVGSPEWKDSRMVNGDQGTKESRGTHIFFL